MIDLGHDTLFNDHATPEEAFEEYAQEIWYKYDANQDGYINFEEFLPIHLELLDN